MKCIAALSLCLFISAASFGQTAPKQQKNAPGQKTANPAKYVITGKIKDMRNKPIKGVQAFVYKPDSTIIASGFTDTGGHYETNSVLPGAYYVKLVYPGATGKMAIVSGVTVKTASTELNVKANVPDADTAYTYEALMPPPEVKKDGKKEMKKK